MFTYQTSHLNTNKRGNQYADCPGPVRHIKGKLLTLITSTSQTPATTSRTVATSTSHCDFSPRPTPPLLTQSWPPLLTQAIIGDLHLSQPCCTLPPHTTFALIISRVWSYLLASSFFLLFVFYFLSKTPVRINTQYTNIDQYVPIRLDH